MSVDFKFRKDRIKTLPPGIGVYVLCDLDGTPIYVGQSKADGIRARVGRHTTSARSDIIANRQLDVWEIAYVWAYPVETPEESEALEAKLFHHFDRQSRLMNGTTFPPPPVDDGEGVPEPSMKVAIMTEEEIAYKTNPIQRLPRQADHYANIVNHFLNVKNSPYIARAIDAHFERLKKQHVKLLGLPQETEAEPEDSD